MSQRALNLTKKYLNIFFAGSPTNQHDYKCYNPILEICLFHYYHFLLWNLIL